MIQNCFLFRFNFGDFKFNRFHRQLQTTARKDIRCSWILDVKILTLKVVTSSKHIFTNRMRSSMCIQNQELWY